MEQILLDQSQRQAYEERGYVTFKHLIPRSIIDHHLAEFEGLLARHDVSGRGDIDQAQGERRARINEDIAAFHQDPKSGLRLCRSQALHSVAACAFGKESVSWGPVTVIWGGGAVPHRDVIHYRDPVREAVRFWVALEDLHPESGLMYIVPGSHRSAYRYDEIIAERPEFLCILQKLASGTVDVEKWQSTIKPILDSHHAESAEIAEVGPKELLRFSKGDVLMFNPAIVHGSLVPGDFRLTRKSFIVECRTRNCRVFSMRAYFGSKHDYRRPENASLTQIVESPLGPYGKSAEKQKYPTLPRVVGCELATNGGERVAANLSALG